MARFSNAAEWDPGVTEATEVDTRGARPRQHLPAAWSGPSVGPSPSSYRIDEIDRPHRVVLSAENAMVRSTDVIEVGRRPRRRLDRHLRGHLGPQGCGRPVHPPARPVVPAHRGPGHRRAAGRAGGMNVDRAPSGTLWPGPSTPSPRPRWPRASAASGSGSAAGWRSGTTRPRWTAAWPWSPEPPRESDWPRPPPWPASAPPCTWWAATPPEGPPRSTRSRRPARAGPLDLVDISDPTAVAAFGTTPRRQRDAPRRPGPQRRGAHPHLPDHRRRGGAHGGHPRARPLPADGRPGPAALLLGLRDRRRLRRPGHHRHGELGRHVLAALRPRCPRGRTRRLRRGGRLRQGQAGPAGAGRRLGRPLRPGAGWPATPCTRAGWTRPAWPRACPGSAPSCARCCARRPRGPTPRCGWPPAAPRWRRGRQEPAGRPRASSTTGIAVPTTASRSPTRAVPVIRNVSWPGVRHAPGPRRPCREQGHD